MSPAEPAGGRADATAGLPWPRRVLVVARWYPAHDDPARGSFVSDGVSALRARGIEVVVASWENADVHAAGPAGEQVARQAVAAWSQTMSRASAVSTPRRWGAEVPVARLPAVHAGDARRAAVAIEAHAALLVPFAAALARRWPFDLVHAHVGIPDGAAAARVAAAAGVPLVVTEHASTAPEQLTDEGARQAYRDLFGPGRRVVAVSHALATRVEGALAVASGTMPIVPNVVPLDRFPLGPAAGRDPDELLWVGARRESKGLETLLRAVRLARDARPALHLRLVGRAPDQATELRWRALAAELGIGNAVVFDPPADRAGVAAALRRAGIFVHPSPFETFGMVAAEALASGLPVVARRSGGVEEVLAGQDAGAELVEVGDAEGGGAEALAAGIVRLRSRLPEVEPAALRAVIAQRYAPERVAEALLGHARAAAAEIGSARAGSARGARTVEAPATAPSHEVDSEGAPSGDRTDAGELLVVGLRRATTARRVAALPDALLARLTVVTAVAAAGGSVELSPAARWIEVDADKEYSARLAELGGPADPRRTALRRLLAAVRHPRRARLRARLVEERAAMRGAAERRAVLDAWRTLPATPHGHVVIVAVGAEDVLAAADAREAGARLAPGGLRWAADRWDAAGPP